MSSHKSGRVAGSGRLIMPKPGKEEGPSKELLLSLLESVRRLRDAEKVAKLLYAAQVKHRRAKRSRDRYKHLETAIDLIVVDHLFEIVSP